jgi:hypothetical protein
MASPLTARLDKLEEKFPDQRKSQRVIRVIVRHDEDEGLALAAQGYDPDSDFASFAGSSLFPRQRLTW